MKRTPLRRKTGLKRKSRMNRESAKHAKRRREAASFRSLAREKPCALCGSVWRPREVHEIAAGPCRQEALDKAWATLALCRRCHERVQVWPRGKQLCLKQAREGEEYDLESYNAIAIRRVDQEDVDKFRRELGFD